MSLRMLIGICASLLLPAVAWAQPAFEPGQLIRMHAEEAGIPSEVVEEILDISRDARIGRDILVADLDRARAEVELLLREEQPDMEAVNEALEILGDAETALRQYDVAVLVEMRSLLTPEQREAMADFFPPRPGREGHHTQGDGPAFHP